MAKYQFMVEVTPQYLHDQSNPDEDLYVFAYTITITNTGETPAQLISRTWNVNDAHGHTEKVRGLGVVGAWEPGSMGSCGPSLMGTSRLGSGWASFMPARIKS